MDTFGELVPNRETDCLKRTMNSQEAIARGAVLAALQSRDESEKSTEPFDKET